MSNGKTRGSSAVALSALTLLVAGVGMNPSASAAESINLVPSQLSSPLNLSEASGMPTTSGPASLQQDIHHHNWLGGDNDVVTKDELVATAGVPQGRFDV